METAKDIDLKRFVSDYHKKMVVDSDTNCFRMCNGFFYHSKICDASL